MWQSYTQPWVNSEKFKVPIISVTFGVDSVGSVVIYKRSRIPFMVCLTFSNYKVRREFGH